MESILKWDSVDKHNWTHDSTECYIEKFVYKLDRLPNFSDTRFSYLTKEIDNRAVEVAKKQIQMLRSFSDFTSTFGISMRIMKKEESLVLYLIFRCSTNFELTDIDKNTISQRIQNSLMSNEYSFQYLTDEDELDSLFSTDWVNEIVEISKYEQSYLGDIYPNQTSRTFYSVTPWGSADNNMEYICDVLVKNPYKAVIDVTLVPTVYLAEEKDWMNTNLNILKECMNGETIKTAQGKVLWQGKKLPILKTPIDAFEKMNKQYETSRIFLSSVRVYAQRDAENLAASFVTNSVSSKSNKQIFRRGYMNFEYLCDCYNTVDISAKTHSRYWNLNQENTPMRAQRLNRLMSVEEAINFFRLPIPIKSGFPGFILDTGLKDFSTKKKIKSTITLGNYLDIPGSDSIKASFDVQQFAKHGLIVGVPGSGKTTAMFNILYQLWAQEKEKKIPFIILEPAKTEYRALKTLPEFKDDLLVFTLGDETTSPFRFNPMEVLPGIRLENHISRLQACFIGAFDLFDPLPVFLEQAIYRTYRLKGWYDDSVGGDPGLETPTLSDLCESAEYIVSHSGFDAKMRSNFQASLLERLNSLRRGSKGRMLDTKHTIPLEDLMSKPVVLELDSLNGSEKSLMMMFLLSYVFEYCKVKRKSGSSLKHMMLVEEAHNLIGSQGGGSVNRADPKEKTIELFTNMLAEMRALGEGILIADQLPTAIAPQAVKQTNVKILMRVTAKDDREEIGNTMDLNEEQMHQVINFKTGHSYLYHEGEDRVRMLRMLNFKGDHNVEEPPIDTELKQMMEYYELAHPELYLPYKYCEFACKKCDRRVRNQVETFLGTLLEKDPYISFFGKDILLADITKKSSLLCNFLENTHVKNEIKRLSKRYGSVGDSFYPCVLVQLYEQPNLSCVTECKKNCQINHMCECKPKDRIKYLQKNK